MTRDEEMKNWGWQINDYGEWAMTASEFIARKDYESGADQYWSTRGITTMPERITSLTYERQQEVVRQNSGNREIPGKRSLSQRAKNAIENFSRYNSAYLEREHHETS